MTRSNLLAAMHATLALVPMLALVGCDRNATPSLPAFEQRWHEAVNTRHAEQLFDMLDSRSRQNISHDLEVMRGLAAPLQQAVIDQLGGDRVETLHDMTADRYFALLWHKATDGRRPTMSVEAAGPDNAYMILGLQNAQVRVRLVVEAGQWVWVLPEQHFERPPTAPPPSPKVPPPATS